MVQRMCSCSRRSIPRASRASLVPHRGQISVLLSTREIAGGSLNFRPQRGQIWGVAGVSFISFSLKPPRLLLKRQSQIRSPGSHQDRSEGSAWREDPVLHWWALRRRRPSYASLFHLPDTRSTSVRTSGKSPGSLRRCRVGAHRLC